MVRHREQTSLPRCSTSLPPQTGQAGGQVSRGSAGRVGAGAWSPVFMVGTAPDGTRSSRPAYATGPGSHRKNPRSPRQAIAESPSLAQDHLARAAEPGTSSRVPGSRRRGAPVRRRWSSVCTPGSARRQSGPASRASGSMRRPSSQSVRPRVELKPSADPRRGSRPPAAVRTRAIGGAALPRGSAGRSATGSDAGHRRVDGPRQATTGSARRRPGWSGPVPWSPRGPGWSTCQRRKTRSLPTA